MKEIKTIAIHNSNFHADDVFSVAIMQLIYPKVEVIRTRDEEILKKVDMRIDVGYAYNPETLDFDHHQPEGAGVRENGIPYASVGVIWKNFWKYLVKTEDEYSYLDEKLIQTIDAFDVGYEIYETRKINPYTLPMLIATMNPDWQDKNQDYDKAFFKAVKFAKQILKIELKKAKGKTKSIKILQSAVKKNGHGNILVLDTLVPWKNFLAKEDKIIYVVYQVANGSWHSQGVPVTKDTFRIKRDFPDSWGGLRDDELVEKTGVEDAIFCHRNLFLSVAKSKKGAIRLAELALKK